MSIDKAVDSTQLDADLTSVANAIRTKGGTSAQLAFPAGFVQAIGDIETGGSDEDLVKMINGTLQSLESDITVVREYAFYKMTALKNVTLTGNVWIKGSAFSGCTGITSFSAKKAHTIYGDAFAGVNCDALVFPNITSELGSQSLANFKGTKVDLGGSGLGIRLGAFSNATNFNTLILRKSSVATLANVSAFNGSPFASGKTGGTLYVPQALIASYQSASNWSTILGYPNNRILPIEGSIYETQYADGTPITA